MILKLCDVAGLPQEGRLKGFAGGRVHLCVGVLNGRPYAIDNECPHQRAPLASGSIADGYVVCPIHGWRFRLADGSPERSNDPAVETYEVRIYGDEVFVRVPASQTGIADPASSKESLA
ncbi:Rieske (2Fe-2S) protein [Granulicella sibirica]|uniref:Rieske 2Fe-2S family protein n=1 Tax=Granulicella sibirica TaxID=2479048 RepID=A0A4Q0T407_9BACT|nr:Rieske (2Fe-2S) protein [Granulicella sibirica]RXH58037.1 Rieske 2Fe-2S family protein [Granulicella sibirica]